MYDPPIEIPGSSELQQAEDELHSRSKVANRDMGRCDLCGGLVLRGDAYYEGIGEYGDATPISHKMCLWDSIDHYLDQNWNLHDQRRRK